LQWSWFINAHRRLLKLCRFFRRCLGQLFLANAIVFSAKSGAVQSLNDVIKRIAEIIGAGQNKRHIQQFYIDYAKLVKGKGFNGFTASVPVQDVPTAEPVNESKTAAVVLQIGDDIYKGTLTKA
jgi:hypothetical protein